MELPVDYKKTHWSVRKLVREEYIRRQEGKCYHCKCPLKGEPAPREMKRKVNPRLFPDGFFEYPVHLHHSHSNGYTLGAVHAHCNAVLWQYYGE